MKLDLRITMEEISAYTIRYLKEELEQQGHKLTGNLENSLEAIVTDTGKMWTSEVMWEAYGGAVNNGVKADRIPYSPGSGAKHSKYIAGLIRFVELRRMAPAGSKEAVRIAFAIARKHKQEGMPTRGSYRFSQNGRRMLAVQFAVGKAWPGIVEGIEKNAGEAIEKLLSEVFEDLYTFGAVTA